MGMRALALWFAVTAVACAAAYTVDCNHEYTDCDNELSKLAGDDEDIQPSTVAQSLLSMKESSTPGLQTTSVAEPTTPKITTTNVPSTSEIFIENSTESTKPKPRLINLSIDELQSFAKALHNQTDEIQSRKHVSDLSDVNLDEEDDAQKMMEKEDIKGNEKISDKFFSNLHEPFNPLLPIDRGSDELEGNCKENGISYKTGEKIERGCEETCECVPGGIFDCTPRCKHPYIRRGRRLNDPLCFESPVDECCSIIACATGNSGEIKSPGSKIDMCRYGNDSYPMGAKWNIGCEQICSCEPKNVVTCKPRCEPLPQSDKCINVQDPNDICCQVQVCDVSQDVHEEPLDNITSTTSSTTTEKYQLSQEDDDIFEDIKTSMRPLVLAEPIGSVRVLQNNSVQVNLIHLNKTEDPIHLLLSSDGGRTFQDVELKYSNLILNLKGGKDYVLKTKETGTKFNFTITAMDTDVNEVPTEDFNATKIGCYNDGVFYAVGEEFHIGCEELCECTGKDTRECAALQCPNHVGLELVSRGCVHWAPSPPPQPPNCCPRSARCLSDGTCHYDGHAVPNWSEVPISLTGCERRCFCENGELDCQDVCTALPPVPPQNFRCPPLHRPMPVNVSDEDCCKQWGCVPNARASDSNDTFDHQYSMTSPGEKNKITFNTPIPPNEPTPVLSLPTVGTQPFSPLHAKHIDINGLFKFKHPHAHSPMVNVHTNTVEPQKTKVDGDNITVFTPEDFESPIKILRPEPSLTVDYSNLYNNINLRPVHSFAKIPAIGDGEKLSIQNIFHNIPPDRSLQAPIPNKISIAEKNRFFIPVGKPSLSDLIKLDQRSKQEKSTTKKLFEPFSFNESSKYNIFPKLLPKTIPSENSHHHTINSQGKHVTILRSKDTKRKSTDRSRENIWPNDNVKHILRKKPSPYQSIFSKVTDDSDHQTLHDSEITKAYAQRQSNIMPSKFHSLLDLEHIINQMEAGSRVNKHLSRSAAKTQNNLTEAGATALPGISTSKPQPHQPPFLPTIPPGINYPQEDIPDYDQNNIHRPENHPLEPVLPTVPVLPPRPPGYGEENKKLSVISLQADSPTSVKMLFGLPPVLVGLRGSVDLRYTDKTDEDISRWYSQVFAPADEVLSTSRLEFRLTGLKPSTLYRVRGKLYLHNLPVEPESDVYTVRTLDLPTMEEKRREIDSRLTVVDVNDTSALVTWRHFTEEELTFIDGIQVRYRPVGTPIYLMTELLHHSRSNAELHDLRPGSKYEASLVLVPPPRNAVELHDPASIQFTTAPYVDPYNWSVVVEARAVGSESAELTWRGVPSPAERWVRVYRAAHECGSGRAQEHDEFRLAARDQPPAIKLSGLEPNTKCRVWLELFLTNGKVKTSNVLEVNTKSLDEPEPIDNVIEASSVGSRGGASRGDYYGALVVVGVIAALGALTSLLLLLIVVRRHRPRSVPITPVPSAPRESSLPPYDNPAYKLELQQETMDL